nr:MAG TPA: hypothetical protein [Caudoviricetes sp.]
MLLFCTSPFFLEASVRCRGFSFLVLYDIVDIS